MKPGDDSKLITQFASTANEYCTLNESCGSLDPVAFCRDCFSLVSRLLFEVVDLPNVGDLNSVDRITYEESKPIVDRLKQQIDERDYDQMLFDPWEANGDPLCGSISDDLSDIWADIKHGLNTFNAGKPSDAACEWRFSFQTHWGPHHATPLLRPLFSLAFADLD